MHITETRQHLWGEKCADLDYSTICWLVTSSMVSCATHNETRNINNIHTKNMWTKKFVYNVWKAPYHFISSQLFEQQKKMFINKMYSGAAAKIICDIKTSNKTAQVTHKYRIQTFKWSQHKKIMNNVLNIFFSLSSIEWWYLFYF